ncbi:MAG: HAMP domain-containing histidine kinase [Planctomycetia bacterium]|nr:HAMP domain-containing histidine kinase [Planctomycetia bacterium]
MKRPWQVWLVFLVALAVVVSAMGWISHKGLELDDAQIQARDEAAVEEDVRLALWRIDSFLSNMLVQEGSRPYFAYTPLYPAERAYGNMLNETRATDSELLLPSPLLLYMPPHVRLHFQIPVHGGKLVSPQAPDEKLLAKINPVVVPDDVYALARQRLSELERFFLPDEVAKVLPRDVLSGETLSLMAQNSAGPQQAPWSDRRRDTPAQQLNRANWEFNARSQSYQQATANTAPQTLFQPGQQGAGRRGGEPRGGDARGGDQNSGRGQGQAKPETPPKPHPPAQPPGGGGALPRAEPVPEVSVGAVKPVWIGDELLLARWVTIGSDEYLQGVWMDWPSLRQELLASIHDLFPGAKLVAVHGGETQSALQRMSSVIPVRLEAAAAIAQPRDFWSPMRVSLAVAWFCVAGAALAVAGLLLGVVRLSERRAAFVSAVTHELRTPLTTFRMYAEMLSEGMVQKPEQQKRYLDTLRIEAERLTHLVENVLSYARLERGRGARPRQPIAVRDLLAQLAPRLKQRAVQAEMELALELPDEVAERAVVTDPAAVEQVLFNLVDNACKYAATAQPREISLSAAASGKHVELRVRDHGPGLAAAVRSRLFRPFTKSASEAAHSAPGVGLGLALSRRLARQLGGDLRYEAHDGQGASFVLTLPAA